MNRALRMNVPSSTRLAFRKKVAVLSSFNKPHQQSFACLSTTPTPTTLRHKPPFNPALNSVKEQGMKVLQSLTQDVQRKTKYRLLITDEDTDPTPEQIQEADRLKSLAEEAVEEYTSQKGGLFCIMNQPIAIIDVEITQDLRNARVFWSLPYEALLMDVKIEYRTKAVERMQKVLDSRGGALQGMIHRKLRHYFRPPKIRFVPAEGEMLRSVLKDMIS